MCNIQVLSPALQGPSSTTSSLRTERSGPILPKVAPGHLSTVWEPNIEEMVWRANVMAIHVTFRGASKKLCDRNEKEKLLEKWTGGGGRGDVKNKKLFQACNSWKIGIVRASKWLLKFSELFLCSSSVALPFKPTSLSLCTYLRQDSNRLHTLLWYFPHTLMPN